MEEACDYYSLLWSQHEKTATPKTHFAFTSENKLHLELPTISNMEDALDNYLLCTLQYLWKYWDSTHSKGKAKENQH